MEKTELNIIPENFSGITIIPEENQKTSGIALAPEKNSGIIKIQEEKLKNFRYFMKKVKQMEKN